MNKFTYPNPRPKLVIEYTGGGMISNCYDYSTWKITSTNRLNKETILAMNKLGLVGFGQEFFIRSQCDDKEPWAGLDVVECVETTQQGVVVPGVPINPYSGKPYAPCQMPYFEYMCEARCDSGD